MYCSLAAAYAEIMRSVKQERSRLHLNSHKCAFCILESFQVCSSKDTRQDRSPREHKSVLVVVGIEKESDAVNATCDINFGFCVMCHF